MSDKTQSTEQIEARIRQGETDLIRLIPLDRYVLRRIVGARAQIDPETGEPLFSWRRLAALLGADHLAVKRWHGQGIALIAAGIEAGKETINAR